MGKKIGEEKGKKTKRKNPELLPPFNGFFLFTSSPVFFAKLNSVQRTCSDFKI